MSVKSMTGFARVRRELPEGELVVSLKSVNHRGLDLHFHIPPSLDAFEPAIRTILKSRVSRGHVQIQISLSMNRNGNTILNHEMLSGWLAAFKDACNKYNLKCEPDLNEAMRIPGILQTEGVRELDAAFEAPPQRSRRAPPSRSSTTSACAKARPPQPKSASAPPPSANSPPKWRRSAPKPPRHFKNG